MWHVIFLFVSTLGIGRGKTGFKRRVAWAVIGVGLIVACRADGENSQSVGKVRSGAELAFSKGDIEGALKMWSQVIAMEPNNDANFFKRFRVFLRQNKYKEALADLNSALSIKPTNEGALVQKGKLEMRMGRCSEAFASLQKLQKYVQNSSPRILLLLIHLNSTL